MVHERLICLQNDFIHEGFSETVAWPIFERRNVFRTIQNCSLKLSSKLTASLVLKFLFHCQVRRKLF